MNKILFLILLTLVSPDYLFSDCFGYYTGVNLPPLENNETLEWEYDSNLSTLEIYKEKDYKKTLYTSIDDLDWNNWEVSKDRKSIIYWEESFDYETDGLADYYLLDGHTGRTTSLGKLHEGYTSSDFKYLIYKDSNFEPKVKFQIYNIQTNTYEKEIVWSLKSEKYFSEEENTAYILRSDLPEYDFHIFLVGAGKYIFAEGYLSVKQNKIITLADDEDDDRVLDLNSFSMFELGK